RPDAREAGNRPCFVFPTRKTNQISRIKSRCTKLILWSPPYYFAICCRNVTDPTLEQLTGRDHRLAALGTPDASHPVPQRPESLLFARNCHGRLGLSGISRISLPHAVRSSASWIACANNGRTGMAPASPAPLMPSGLSGDSVTVWLSSMLGTSSEVGSR